jgi:hypothetical protein
MRALCFHTPVGDLLDKQMGQVQGWLATGRASSG